MATRTHLGSWLDVSVHHSESVRMAIIELCLNDAPYSSQMEGGLIIITGAILYDESKKRTICTER